MDTVLKILLVEDSESDAALLIRHLKKENINFTHTRVWNRTDYTTSLKENTPDLIIADQALPQFSGMEAFRIIKSKDINIPFILVTGSVSEKLLTEFSKEGIDDYILKGNLLRLATAIENALSKKRIAQLHKQLEIAYLDIKNSINYAKIIQEAMLPEESDLNDTFPGSFIFFKPKDTLSGDFYWLKKYENIFSIAVADCTGHGVPGALLSMMGFNILYEIFSAKKTLQPSEVLGKLNHQVRKILKHGDTTLNVGMDIALCAIDVKNKSMVYSGANRPLLIQREKELIEFKPDKISIGEMDNNQIQFTNHSISLKTGDRVFLFSDGYADQFSEKIDKKLTMKRLREILIQTSGLSFKKQKEFIMDFFESWKGNNEQVDDVLLMCIQIA